MFAVIKMVELSGKTVLQNAPKSIPGARCFAPDPGELTVLLGHWLL